LFVENHWDSEAENWIKWARTPGFDSYWFYRDVFFHEIVPAPQGATLEIGCGEGRVARDLAQRGHWVIGVDSSAKLVHTAAEADQKSGYIQADVNALPFEKETFNLVVAYNCLMDVDDMPAALAEASRVLRPEGRLAVCVTHPMNDAGQFVDARPDSQFVISGAYLGARRHFNQTFRRGGREIRLRCWCYPLETYLRALEDAGFAIERLREPAANDESVKHFGESNLRRRRIPVFLMFRALKLR